MEDLFRKEAVDSVSSRLDTRRRVRAVTIYWRVIFVLLLLFTSIFVAWLFFGTVNESITVKGIVWSNVMGGKVQAKTYGSINQIMVSMGDRVSAGDIIAVMPDNDILYELKDNIGGLSGEEIKDYYNRYQNHSVLCSPVDGVVMWVNEKNTWVSEGDTVAYIAPYNNELDYTKIIAFIESSKSGLVTPNMEVHISPEYAPQEKYGYISAYVSDIDDVHMNSKTIQSLYEYLPITQLDDDVNYIKVEITMHFADDSGNKFLWSNKAGEVFNVDTGTLCDADIIINNCTPFEWLIGRTL